MCEWWLVYVTKFKVDPFQKVNLKECWHAFNTTYLNLWTEKLTLSVVKDPCVINNIKFYLNIIYLVSLMVPTSVENILSENIFP